MAVDPKNPDVIYSAGHGGEAFHFSRSDDNGKSWKATGTGLGAGDPLAGPRRRLDALRRRQRPRDLEEHRSRRELERDRLAGLGHRRHLSPAGRPGESADPLGGDRGRPQEEHRWRRIVDRSATRAPAATSCAPSPSIRATRARCSPRFPGPASFAAATAARAGRPQTAGSRPPGSTDSRARPKNETLYVRASVGLYRRDPSGSWSEVQAPFADGKEADPELAFDRAAPRGMWAFGGGTLWRSPNDGLRWDEMKLKEVKLSDLMKGRTSQAEFGSFAQDPGQPAGPLRRRLVVERAGARGVEIGRRRQELGAVGEGAPGRGGRSAPRRSARGDLRAGRRRRSLPERRRGRLVEGARRLPVEAAPRVLSSTRRSRRVSSSRRRMASSARPTAVRAGQRSRAAWRRRTSRTSRSPPTAASSPAISTASRRASTAEPPGARSTRRASSTPTSAPSPSTPIRRAWRPAPPAAGCFRPSCPRGSSRPSCPGRLDAGIRVSQETWKFRTIRPGSCYVLVQ